MEFKIASYHKRLLAYLIDILPIVGIIFAICYLLLGFDQTFHEYLNDQNNIDKRVEFYKGRNSIRDLSLLIWIIYSGLMDSSPLQGTLGKYVMRVKVTDYDGNKLSFKKGLLRNFSKVISTIPLGFGLFWIFFDKKNRTWHDQISSTLVLQSH